MGNLGVEKPLISVIVLGQKDHGKTTLSAAISKVLAEEDLTSIESYQKINNPSIKKNQGLEIQTSEIEYESSLYHYRHTDLPTHKDIAKSLISKAVTPDLAIIVVSIMDYEMPETKEQVFLASKSNIKNVVIFLNKCEFADNEEDIKLMETEIREIVEGNGYSDDIRVVSGSALEALNGNPEEVAKIECLIDVIEETTPLPIPIKELQFLMPIDEVMSITGKGTIATGIIERGIVQVGDSISVVTVDDASYTIVTGVQKNHKITDRGEAGESVGILLRGIGKAMIERGGVLARPDSIRAFRSFKAIAYFLTKEEGGRSTPISNEYKSQLYMNLLINGVLTFEYPETISPGTIRSFSVGLAGRIAMEEGGRFTIREGAKTVGIGIVSKILE